MQTELKPTLRNLTMIHKEYATFENAVGFSLLDGYFLSLSPIARQVRRTYLELGFQFKKLSQSPSENFYYQFQYFLLPQELAEKTIYGRPTGNFAEFLLSTSPSFAEYDLDVLLPTVLNNKLLHESIHLICFNRFFPGQNGYAYNKNWDTETTKNWILAHLSIEGCVLATELLSSLVTETACALYTTRSSCHQRAEPPADFAVIRDSIQELGLKRVFNILARGFLAANLRPNSPNLPTTAAKEILQDLNPEKHAGILLRSTQLSQTFRRESNNRYFNSLGMKSHFPDVAEMYALDEGLDSDTAQKTFDFCFSTLVEPAFR